jgi:NAD(P)-dependent dehydrogenase (short-subunit alcohol dehydrogenase family)
VTIRGAIGRQIAIAFAQHGAKVSIADMNQQLLNETVDIIHSGVKDRTADCISAVIDVSSEKEVEKWIQHTHQQRGSIDILVNNAARFIFGEVDKVTCEDWDAVLASNVKGYAFCAKHSVRIMKEQRSGAILNIASISSIVSQPKFVPYNTSKAAVLQMAKNIAHDVGEYGIRCNAIG